MSNQKHFGVWMDTQHATVVGSDNEQPATWTVIAHVEGKDVSINTNDRTESNQREMLRGKFFKEIATHIHNATHLHATGTGQVQEQFIHFLADSPQFKNVKTEESTANKMSDENLVKYFAERG